MKYLWSAWAVITVVWLVVNWPGVQTFVGLLRAVGRGFGW